MPGLRASSRFAAAVGAILYALGFVVLPALHLATHRPDHTHGAPTALKVEWARVQDPTTGRVDLERLAEELGLSDDAHAKAHAEKRPHEHGKSSEGAAHGRGSAEHFSLAFLDAPSVPTLVFADAVLPVLPSPSAVEAPPSRLLFLRAQRAQAPPA